ncbi:MAG: nitrous oxide reductase accessory protein NosL [Flavobacteriaceae bacterium]
MKVVIRVVLSIICFNAVGACKIEPQPISYGSDTCQFCSMTIVDKQHGSEIVTKKGKIYKFDAVECLLNYRKQNGDQEIGMYLCNHYTNPGELIPVEDAIFLISEGIPSPMGAYLTAFDSENSALEAKNEHGGSLYNWNELIEHWEE